MKISCDIIRDLLPLYAEDMTSKASNDMVEEHLGECEGCRGYLDALQRPAKLPEQIPVQNLKHIKKEIRKRRILAMLMAVFMVLSLWVGVQSYLDAFIILTADQAVDHVEELEDGGVRVYWNHVTRGFGAVKVDNDPGNWGMLITVRRSDLLFPKNAAEQMERDRIPEIQAQVFGSEEQDGIYPSKDNYWYVNPKDGTADMLLWQGEAELPAPGYVFGDPSYALAWWCVGAGVLAVIFALAAWMLRGRRAGKWIRYGALLSGSLCLSILFASGGQFVSHHGEFYGKIDQSFINLVFWFLSGYFAFKLWDLNHPLPVRECPPEVTIKETRRARKLLAILTVLLLVFSLGMCIYSFLNVATWYLTADEAIMYRRELDSEHVEIQYSNLVFSSGGYSFLGDTKNQRERIDFRVCRGTVKDVLLHRLQKNKNPLKEGGNSVYSTKDMGMTSSCWYLNPKDGKADLFLYGREDEKTVDAVALRNYGLAWYCTATAACTVILWLLANFQPRAGKYLRYAALLSGSLCIAGLCISGGEFYKYEQYMLGYRIRNSLITACPIFLTGLSALKLYDLKK